MADVVIIAREHRHDPLGRDEEDIVERLHAMADDALAGKNKEAVQREVDVACRLLGLRDK